MMDEGYDSLENLRGLELNDLIEDIGMKKGHARRLLHEIQSIGSADKVPVTKETEDEQLPEDEVGESKVETSTTTKSRLRRRRNVNSLPPYASTKVSLVSLFFEVFNFFPSCKK